MWYDIGVMKATKTTRKATTMTTDTTMMKHDAMEWARKLDGIGHWLDYGLTKMHDKNVRIEKLEAETREMRESIASQNMKIWREIKNTWTPDQIAEARKDAGLS